MFWCYRASKRTGQDRTGQDWTGLDSVLSRVIATRYGGHGRGHALAEQLECPVL